MFTVGSLFDGSGTAPLAAVLCGMEPVWASEIEPFPVAVTTKRFPNMKHYGDITRMHGDGIEPVDVIVGGSPCQDLSIAGLRAGLQEGERSSLFYEQIRIIKEMRNSGRTAKPVPRFGVWENVPGAFSSNKGEDFRCVLEEFCKIKDPNAHVPMPKNGKWGRAGLIVGKDYSVGWRLFDAQYWGVPQRRRRIYLVADFDGECARKILFERPGLSRNFEESRRTWEGTAQSSVRRTDRTSAGFIGLASSTAGSVGYQKEIAPTLRAGITSDVLSVENHPNDSRVRLREDGSVQTLSSRMGTGGGNTPLILENSNKKFDEKENISSIYCMTTGCFQQIDIDKSPTLSARDYKSPQIICPNPISEKNICFSSQSYYEYAHNTVSSTLKAHGGEYGGGSETIVKQKKLRRLTPQECARLQGFPYWWADDVDGYSDSKAYKMWGNGMALPNMLFVIEGIKEELDKEVKKEGR